MGPGTTSSEEAARRAPADIDTPPSRRTRLAAWVFGIYVAAAWPLIVLGIGRYFWFLGDDWDFLSDRTAGSLSDLFRPHAEHWSTLPVLVFRLEWHLFGLHYHGYQATVVALHLGVAVMLRVVMRRAGVDPWIATAAAGSFVLFSPGYENILWSFQIGMVGSLLFGLVQLVLADTDGPWRRRDWLALLAGLAGLMCSGIGPVMVGVVGVAVWIRRGWKVALGQTAPLAVIFLVWFATYRDQQPKTPGHVPAHDLVAWLWQGFSGTFRGLGHYPIVAILMAAMFAGGLVLAWVIPVAQRRSADLHRRAAAPFALLLGVVGFQIATANARWAFGSTVARSPRYLHATAAFLLPALAVAADAVARRWRHALPAVIVLLLLPIPANIKGFDAKGTVFSPQYFDNHRQLVEGIAWSPFATKVHRDDRPIRDILGGTGPPVGWLVDARRAGEIPHPGPLTTDQAEQIRIRLGLAQSAAGAHPEAGLSCRTYRHALDVRAPTGTNLVILTPVGVRLLDAEPMFFAQPYLPLAGERLRIALPDLPLSFSPLAPATSFRLCS